MENRKTTEKIRAQFASSLGDEEGSQSHNYDVSQMVLARDWQFYLGLSSGPHFQQTLNPLQEFGVTVTAPVW
jgi:hypothetical protein